MIEPSMLRPVIWVGSSRSDYREFPDVVQSRIGYALYVAQEGGKHRDAKPLKGFHGAGVLEVVADFRGDTFRAVYTVRFTRAIYVLHTFKKKAKSGIATPRADMDLIERRYREAARHAKEGL